ncbi:MAG: enoyl-CoA hydratase/isomerase family protein [Myxococcales bacterium]|nr:enoyl-CoA hydratase/isomerase family protein [Myxococcales bacterium]
MNTTITCVRRGRWAELQMTRPPANAINLAMVDALHAHLDELEADADVDGVLLTGRPGMFSAGLDVVELQPKNRREMTQFWERFGSLAIRIFGTPLVMVAAIEGHAPAGGCVFAMSCDHRVMSAGRFRIGLNEVAVGLAVPNWLGSTFARLVGWRQAERNLQMGRLILPDEAAAIGLVDDVVPPEEVRRVAIAELEARIGVPQAARVKTKQAIRGELAAEMERLRAAQLDELLDTWFSQECRRVMGGLVEQLKKAG